MEYKIGNEVKTTCEHYGKHFYTFEGIIKDIQGNIVSIYGRVSNGLGMNNDKYLRDIHIDNIELSNKWFGEVCWVCCKVKMVHNDEQCTLVDPGFICEKCELTRNDYENLCFEFKYDHYDL